MNEIDAIYSYEDYLKDMEEIKDLLTYRIESTKEYISRFYVYECPNCHWETYRSKLLQEPHCSKCGCIDTPIIIELFTKNNVETAKAEIAALIERQEQQDMCIGSDMYMILRCAEFVSFKRGAAAVPILTPVDKFY